MTVLVQQGLQVTTSRSECELQGDALATQSHAMQHNPQVVAKWAFHPNAPDWCLKYLFHFCLPLPFLLRALLHKGLGVPGNNWASIVAGCGRMPRLLPLLHTLFRRWAIPIYISPGEDTPQQFGRGDHQSKQIISLEHLVLSTNLITAFVFLERNRYHCKQKFALAAQCGKPRGWNLKPSRIPAENSSWIVPCNVKTWLHTPTPSMKI